jgi:hypothetical protein
MVRLGIGLCGTGNGGTASGFVSFGFRVWAVRSVLVVVLLYGGGIGRGYRI